MVARLSLANKGVPKRSWVTITKGWALPTLFVSKEQDFI
jgi:hypothetical protein